MATDERGPAGDGTPDAARLSELLELTQDAILVREVATSVVTYWNRGAQRLYGWTREQARGRVTHELLATRFPVSREAVDASLVQDGFWEGELIHRRRDGSHVVVASRQAIQRDASGTPQAILEINTDITERKAAEAEHLRLAAEQRARQLAERALDRLARLQRLTGALSQALTPAEVGSLVIEHVVSAFGARGGAVRAVAPGSNGPRGLAARGEALGDNGPAADTAVVPLIVDGRVLGEIVLRFDGGRTLEREDRELLEVLASQCAQALERARLYELAVSAHEDLRRSRDQLAAILGGVAEGVTVQDAQGKLVYANDVAARLCGFESGEALLGATGEEVLRRFSLFDEDGRPLSTEHLPGRQLLRGLEAPELVIQVGDPLTGACRWSIVNSAVVRDAEGQLQLVVNIFRDITERKRQTDVAALLAAASRALSETLDPLAGVQRVADLAVVSVADYCAVDLLGGVGYSAQRVCSIRPGEETRALADALGTGDPVAGEAEAAHLVARLSAPLRARGQTFGTLSLGAVSAGRRLGPAEQTLVEDLAARTALALDNARLYREAHEHAEHQATLNAALRETIAERDRALEDLRQALRTRDEFLASASHDLKNPLASIKATAQLLRRRLDRAETVDVARLMEGLRRLDAIATRAAGLVEELLDLARMQMGRPLDLERAPTDLVALVREIAAEQQQGTERHVLAVEADEPAVVGAWDAGRLARVLTNLVDNALKYSPGGGRVSIAVRRAAGDSGQEWATVDVRDEGMGIPSAELDRIFDRFHRASNVEGRISGTGIGLASARHILESHGGSISVSSQEGMGSVFTVRLPLQAAGVDAEGAST